MYMEVLMEQTMNITEARSRLTRLPEELGATDTVKITRKNDPVLAVLSWDFYEALVETLEILGDEETMSALKKGVAAVKEGRTVELEDLERELGS